MGTASISTRNSSGRRHSMKRLNTKYIEPFPMSDHDDFDPTNCISVGHGIWAYAAEYGNGCLMYVFIHPDKDDSDSAMFTYTQGLALELQKMVGGYVTWENCPEGITFMVMNEKAFDDITDDWWPQDDDFPGEWWYGLTQDEIRDRVTRMNVEEFERNKRNLLKLGEE